MNSHTTSMYIPRMAASVTEHYIRDVIENSFIGKVSRVDFTPIGKGPGFRENYDDYSYVKSAFIHFEYHYHNEKSVEIRNKLSEGDSHRLYLNIYKHNGDQEYWILLKATNPVQETMMNKHQIVDNCRFLEDKIAEQELTIIKMSKVIMAMNENISKLNNVQELLVQSLEVKPLQLKREKNVYNVISTEEGEYIDLEDDNMSISSSNSEERMKASCDLCGNE
jgi:hypothetical protein